MKCSFCFHKFTRESNIDLCCSGSRLANGRHSMFETNISTSILQDEFYNQHDISIVKNLDQDGDLLDEKQKISILYDCLGLNEAAEHSDIDLAVRPTEVREVLAFEKEDYADNKKIMKIFSATSGGIYAFLSIERIN